MRLIWYNRDEFSDRDIAQAKAVANRLQETKLNPDPTWHEFFTAQMRMPIQYEGPTATAEYRRVSK